MEQQKDYSLSNKEIYTLSLVLLAVVAMIGVDMVIDYNESPNAAHLVFEIGLAISASLGFATLMRILLSQRRLIDRKTQQIATAHRDLDKWRAESEKFTLGLSQAIDSQLERWSLSPSEKEVALMLLKGLSLKEIATLRNTTEQTARVQSAAVYAKSGMSGRTELSAFFLEDLLTPTQS